MKTACILGATGLVGAELLSQLLLNNDFDKVIIFIRRDIALTHSKLVKHTINFDDTDSWKQLVVGDVLFSAFGTTIKKAGSKEVQYKIDYTYQYEFAKAAAQNGVKKYVLISSAGANVESSTFYTRIKGKLDSYVSVLNFEQVSIIRPSLLDGNRKETRLGEQIGIIIANALSFIPPVRKYRPIKVNIVATAMISAFRRQNEKIKIYELEEIRLLAKDLQSNT